MFALVAVWHGSYIKHAIIDVSEIRSMTQADSDGAPPLVNVSFKHGANWQLVGTLDQFIPMMQVANFANNIPEMTAEQLAKAKAEEKRFIAEQEAKREAEKQQAIDAAVAEALKKAAPVSEAANLAEKIAGNGQNRAADGLVQVD